MGLIRELVLLLGSLVLGYKSLLGWYQQQPFSLNQFFMPYSWRVSYVIYLISVDLGPPFVDHAIRYLSACPICRLLQLSVSCSN